jgi:hypothetical protein
MGMNALMVLPSLTLSMMVLIGLPANRSTS